MCKNWYLLAFFFDITSTSHHDLLVQMLVTALFCGWSVYKCVCVCVFQVAADINSMMPSPDRLAQVVKLLACVKEIPGFSCDSHGTFIFHDVPHLFQGNADIAASSRVLSIAPYLIIL
jgi:hypothetical protein